MSAPTFVPACGGEKARRLFHAVRKGGIVKVSPDGSLVWIFENTPSTIAGDGTIIDAREFARKAAEVLQLPADDIYSLGDEEIRDIARRLAGTHPIASHDARGAHNDKN